MSLFSACGDDFLPLGHLTCGFYFSAQGMPGGQPGGWEAGWTGPGALLQSLALDCGPDLESRRLGCQ